MCVSIRKELQSNLCVCVRFFIGFLENGKRCGCVVYVVLLLLFSKYTFQFTIVTFKQQRQTNKKNSTQNRKAIRKKHTRTSVKFILTWRKSDVCACVCNVHCIWIELKCGATVAVTNNEEHFHSSSNCTGSSMEKHNLLTLFTIKPKSRNSSVMSEPYAHTIAFQPIDTHFKSLIR